MNATTKEAMTTNEAKKDLAAKLTVEQFTFSKLSAKTVDFSDLARAKPVFVTIHGGTFTREGMEQIRASIPKPSEGGYIVKFENCQWIETAIA